MCRTFLPSAACRVLCPSLSRKTPPPSSIMAAQAEQQVTDLSCASFVTRECAEYGWRTMGWWDCHIGSFVCMQAHFDCPLLLIVLRAVHEQPHHEAIEVTRPPQLQPQMLRAINSILTKVLWPGHWYGQTYRHSLLYYSHTKLSKPGHPIAINQVDIYVMVEFTALLPERYFKYAYRSAAKGYSRRTRQQLANMYPQQCCGLWCT